MPLRELSGQIDIEGPIVPGTPGDRGGGVALLSQLPMRDFAIELPQEREREPGVSVAKRALDVAERA